MDSSIAVVPLAPEKYSTRRKVGRSLTAALLIACVGINTVCATGLTRDRGTAQELVIPAHLALPSDLAVTESVYEAIEALDEGEIAELDGIYANAGGDATAVDGQKGWRTALAKAILKSSAFKAALRRASERAYVWYMNNINHVIVAIDATQSFTYNGIYAALRFAHVPDAFAKIIARVLSLMLL